MKLRNRWKKWFSLVLSCILLVVSPVTMLADEMPISEEVTIVSSGNCGDNATYVLDSNGLVTISGTGTINLDVYEYYENVKHVVIESGITALDSLALSEYVYLESVELPDTITSIGGWAFQFAAIKEIVLPDSVTILGEEAFTWCESLEKVVLSKNLTTIEDAAFWGCVSLTSLDIPVAVTSIGGAAFEYCDKLTDIYYEGTEEQWNAIVMEADTIPENVTIHYAVSNQENTEDTSNGEKEVYTEEQFEEVLAENAIADTVIASNDVVTITFGKGTMQKVEGQTSYDFTSIVSSDYTEAKVPETVAKESFVAKISFAYSGTLPAEATMKILVGDDYVGKTLYYSLLSGDGILTETQSAVVSSDGYMVVKQSHCSDWVITTTNPNPANAEQSQNPTQSGNGEKVEEATQPSSPKTNDDNIIFVWMMLVFSGIVLCANKKVKENK